MKRGNLLFSIMIVIGLFLTSPVFSQVVHFYKIDASQFPTIKARYIARDAEGIDNFKKEDVSRRYTAADFTIQEDGVDMTPVLDCGMHPDTPAVSVVICIANTYSTNTIVNKEPILTWMKVGAATLVDSLYYVNGTEIAALKFVNTSNTISGFTKTPGNLASRINSEISPQQGVLDFNAPFKNNSYVWNMFTGRADKEIPGAVVLVTDHDLEGDFSYQDADKLSQKAIDNGVFLYTITIINDEYAPYGTNQDLKRAVWATGGMNFDCVTKADVVKAFGKVAHLMQNRENCNLTWQAPYGCTESSKNRTVDINMPDKSFFTAIERTYTAPESSIPQLTISADKLEFGKPSDNNKEQKLTITNNGPAFTIDNFTFEPDGYFMVKDDLTGIKFENGESKDVYFKYSDTPPEEPVTVDVSIASADFFCPDNLPTFQLVADWFVFNYDGELNVNSITMDKTIENDSSTKSDICVLTNKSNAAIKVNVSIENDEEGNYSLTSGSGEQTIDVDKCLKLSVKFSPKTVGTGTKTAKIKIEVTDPASVSETYEIDLSGEVEKGQGVEEIFNAYQYLHLAAVPNPASDMVSITWDVPKYANTKLEIFNALGSHVATLINGELDPDSYGVDYSVANLTPGVYYLRLQAGLYSQTMRLVVTK